MKSRSLTITILYINGYFKPFVVKWLSKGMNSLFFKKFSRKADLTITSTSIYIINSCFLILHWATNKLHTIVLQPEFPGNTHSNSSEPIATKTFAHGTTVMLPRRTKLLILTNQIKNWITAKRNFNLISMVSEPMVPSEVVPIWYRDFEGWLILAHWHTIWWHKSGTTLAQVMAWCLTARNHYLKNID